MRKAVFNQVPVGVQNLLVEAEPVPETQVQNEYPNQPKLSGTRMLLINRTGIPIPEKDNQNQQTISAIVWKRKYIPPSIPIGQYAFGYQENKDGGIFIK